MNENDKQRFWSKVPNDDLLSKQEVCEPEVNPNLPAA